MSADDRIRWYHCARECEARSEDIERRGMDQGPGETAKDLLDQVRDIALELADIPTSLYPLPAEYAEAVKRTRGAP